MRGNNRICMRLCDLWSLPYSNSTVVTWPVRLSKSLFKGQLTSLEKNGCQSRTRAWHLTVSHCGSRVENFILVISETRRFSLFMFLFVFLLFFFLKSPYIFSFTLVSFRVYFLCEVTELSLLCKCSLREDIFFSCNFSMSAWGGSTGMGW